MQSMYRILFVCALAAVLVVPAPAARDRVRTRRGQPRQGTATIESSTSALAPSEVPVMLGMPTAPLSLAKLTAPLAAVNSEELPVTAAAVAPQAKAQIKRIFLQNKCGCNNKTATNAPYPIVALSYQPVQSVDFYTVGYWSVSCQKTYVIATTNSVVYMTGEMSDGSVSWTGDTSLTVYVPSQNTCEEPRKFKEYNLPQNWNDHTISLTC